MNSGCMPNHYFSDLNNVIIVILSLVVKVRKIQPDKFENCLHKFWTWNSKEQLLDINMPRSRTLSEGFMLSIFGLAYTL